MRGTAALKNLQNEAPPRLYKPGRLILDCGGQPHLDWTHQAIRDHQMQAVVFRRTQESVFFPIDSSDPALRLATGNLEDHLRTLAGRVHFLLDDLGALHYHEDPVRLLERYYHALDSDGFGWIRFPNTLWVLQKDHHRIALVEYLVAKYPRVFRRVNQREINESLQKDLSSTKAIVQLRRDRHLETLAIDLKLRSWGGTSVPRPQPHCPVLEFLETDVA